MNRKTMASLLNYAEMHLRLTKLHAQFAKDEKDEYLAMYHDSYYDYYKSRAIHYILLVRKERAKHERQN